MPIEPRDPSSIRVGGLLRETGLQIIGPDPNIIEIVKLYLSKVDVMNTDERIVLLDIIKKIANPPVMFKKPK